MARRRKTIALPLVCVLAASLAYAAHVEQRELQPGVALEAPIAIGELHSYRIALQQNEFFRLVVDQQEADVEVTYYAPDGRRLQRMDCRWYGSEPAPLIAESSGYYRLEIRALRAGKNARCILRPEAPRARMQQGETSSAWSRGSFPTWPPRFPACRALACSTRICRINRAATPKKCARSCQPVPS